MRSCERPRKRSASDARPSSVSNRYSLSIRTQGSSCRRCASSSLRRVSSFSSLSNPRRAASHSFLEAIRCLSIPILLFRSDDSVDQADAPIWKRSSLPKFEPMPSACRRKKCLPFTCDQRINEEPELVDQSGIDEARCDSCAAHEKDILAGLLLERSDFFDPSDEPRPRP